MSIYVPAMQQRDSRAYYQNTAKSFLDAVRMQRDYEHQKAVQDNMIQSQQRALEASQRASEASGRAERQLGMAEEQFKWQKDRRKKMADITQSIVKSKIADSKYQGKTAEGLDTYGIGTNVLNMDIDPDEKRIYFGAPDVGGVDGREIIQYATPREIAKARAKEQGFKPAEFDESLIESLTDPSMLSYLPMLSRGMEGGGNLFLDATLNQLDGMEY